MLIFRLRLFQKLNPLLTKGDELIRRLYLSLLNISQFDEGSYKVVGKSSANNNNLKDICADNFLLLRLSALN
jgi:hypothetical protein